MQGLRPRCSGRADRSSSLSSFFSLPLSQIFHFIVKEDISISIVIPVYKVAPYVERCLKTVMSQTYDRFECILVDDASPDDSMEKCEKMIAGYEGNIRFRILRHAQNRGLSAARNTGTDAATGDYILYVDSDDMLTDDCVENLMAPVLADRSVEMVYAAHMTFTDLLHTNMPKIFAREKAEYKTREEVRDFFLDRRRLFVNAAWNKLTSRELIVKNNLRFPEGQLWEDAIWTFFEMKYVSHLVFIPHVTYFYFQRPDSISFGTGKDMALEHKNKISEVISKNFTPGDEDREAVKYLPDFCNNFMQKPKTRALCATARRFRRALSWRRQGREKMLLLYACILPHNHWGQRRFRQLAKKVWKK